MSPPLWLLDVDGVLNALSARPGRATWPDWEWGTAAVHGVDWPIRFAPAVSAYVTAVHADDRADVRWLTTWGSGANGELARLLGLPQLAVAGEPPEAGGLADAEGVGRWWKADVVRTLVLADPGRPLLWTDDDLAHEPRVTHWVGAHAARSLCLAPDPVTGLSPSDLARVDAFFDGA